MKLYFSKRLALKYFACIASGIFLLTTNSIAQDVSGALVKFDAKWGEKCEKCEYYKGYERSFEDTYTVFFRNTSNVVIDAQVAVQEDNLAWRVYQFKGIHPLDEISAYACRGTGKYYFWVKKENDPELKFPSEDEINSML
ncbi:MAG: hypothetical protein HKO56_03625 [Bacteroidia bacterium]|nr:hypothetical protein [Bacteroidia bacterium]NNM15727.1 hypothetical protein [Bacteroidia bacterium]